MRSLALFSSVILNIISFAAGEVLLSVVNSSSSVFFSGVVIVISTLSGGSKIIETYKPTTYTQYAFVTATVTTTWVNQQGVTVTLTVGPSGVAWTPIDQLSDIPGVSPPSTLPGNAPAHSPSPPSTAISSGASQPSGSDVLQSAPDKERPTKTALRSHSSAGATGSSAASFSAAVYPPETIIPNPYQAALEEPIRHWEVLSLRVVMVGLALASQQQ